MGVSALIEDPGHVATRLDVVGIIGGAGFIGSHFVDRFLDHGMAAKVVVFDNFSSGRRWHLDQHRHDSRLHVVEGDVRDLSALTEAMRDVETIIHLASNPDIARAATEPAVDFDQGTLLTHHVCEAARVCSTRQLLYASGSGVYGDLGEFEVAEDYGPLVPISTYGASKLAGESLIASYCAMFDLTAVSFRFGNVVGVRQTHGVGFDFVQQLLANPSQLRILGDGSQSKSYIAVSDVVDAVLLAASKSLGYSVYNVATGDYTTVKEIATLAIEAVGDGSDIELVFSGGDRGWKGDVPVVRLDTTRIRKLGWSNRLSSSEALRDSLASIVIDARAGRLG
jgi:UDP-glucose 4-epimerase